ncbi:MAG: adenine-specific methyltransferase EcoRI family protein [Paludibacteraceae bacterium]|nr:adenine-specific methyltransferase EcoRI family protein [Paludibacteraceae bacterium]
MGNKNTNLHKAKRDKDDEFYTTYETVEKELSHYVEQFEGQTVLCNCDDPYTSNFSKFFINNFNTFKLKRLICTSYCKAQETPQPTLFDFDMPCEKTSKDPQQGYVLDVDSVDEGNINTTYQKIRTLKGNGDFRSDECVEYLKQSDIVVTNPPFSLFKDFVIEVLKYDKKFLIIGNQNALTYKEIFPLIQTNVVWTGYQFGEMKFRVPSNSEPRQTRYWVDGTGQKWRSLGNAMWLTNLDNDRRHQSLKLTQKFDPIKHRRYDNYDAIHVRNIGEIPSDYSGIMGVPITIISLYNQDQFEIIGEANHGSDSSFDIFKPMIGGREIFKRILIRNKALV